MCPAIVRWKPRPSLATSVVRRVTSCVILSFSLLALAFPQRGHVLIVSSHSRVTAPSKAAVAAGAVLAVAGPPRVQALARNATAVVRSGTSLARVLKLLPTLGMVAEEASVLSGAVEVKLGAYMPSLSHAERALLTVLR